ncbi:MAG TPA: sugar transferase [Gemmatimonadales bacterium]|jgi:lipopolysaccharide/colanic/teichoic acid biosynthesis glycosyltransferase
MAKRPFDLAGAIAGLMIASPILVVACAGIALSSRGPILYRCRRVGLGGRLFTMLKLRTMHVTEAGPRITGAADPRVFGFGALLRRLKIDELPQLINVLRGEMSIIGPRPEDPAFVARHYAPEHRETLKVLPGLASPGSIYSSTHGDRILTGGDPEGRYVELLLPLKLALDRVYVRRASFGYDLTIIGRTLRVIVASLAGWRRFANPPEITAAWRLLVPARRHDAATDALLNRASIMRAPLVPQAAPEADALAGADVRASA